MTEKIRTFIAIKLSPAVRNELAKIQAELKTPQADVKWTKPELIHFTLKFLGYISQNRVEDVKNIMEKVSSKYKPFELSLFNIGCFPKLEYPRVIWVGIDKGRNYAEAFAKNLQEELSQLGFEKEERPFTAHLTLGRVRSFKARKEFVSKIKALDFNPSVSFIVDKITLFQSTLTPTGPTYTPLYESQLNK